ncbi:uncharacterized protein [Heptranchias perlo]|uniref:uncharacterized protein n=1 Tax=Heptranchias perlo TaxID=212740 RepID=UPI003559AA3F
MNFGTWNVRTFMDNPNSDRPERRTAIIEREFRCDNIDIAALAPWCHTWSNAALMSRAVTLTSPLKEQGSGYTFFWKGKPEEEHHLYGIGFAVKNKLVGRLNESPCGVNERLMTLRLTLAKKQFTTVGSAYAPTRDAMDEIKEAFYCSLDQSLSRIPKGGKLILLGDFNARVGRDANLWKGVLGKEGVGKANPNGVLLLTKCREHDLVITNTLFRQRNKYKTPWQHPRCKHWHLIDDIIVRVRDRKDIHITRAMTGDEDCWTDHRLIHSTISINLAPNRQRQKKLCRRRLNVAGLKGLRRQIYSAIALQPTWRRLTNQSHHSQHLRGDSIRQLKNNKAPGADGIPAEVLKYGGEALLTRIHNFITLVWEEKSMSGDLRDTVIVTIFKKGDRSDCRNYREISRLSATGKVIVGILLNRLLPVAEEFLPESQCSFRPSRGTMDMIFSARQVQEKCREQHQPLYMAFFDLAKAFDSVNREGLWSILLKFGCPLKFVTILRLLHDDMQAVILTNGSITDPTQVQTGVKQGCVIAPMLFSIFLTATLHPITMKLPAGVELTYRTSGKLFNLRCLQARTTITPTSVIKPQYADDARVCAHSEAELQTIVDAFSEAYERMGLRLNIRKTKVLYQPALATQHCPPTIKIHEAKLNKQALPEENARLIARADSLEGQLKDIKKAYKAARREAMRKQITVPVRNGSKN